MSHRPLALVSGLTLGDYLLWNWSLSGGHDVLAIVAGLTLPPLALASIWLLAVSIVRETAHQARRFSASRPRRSVSRVQSAPQPLSVPRAPQRAVGEVPSPARSPSRKIAA